MHVCKMSILFTHCIGLHETKPNLEVRRCYLPIDRVAQMRLDNPQSLLTQTDCMRKAVDWQAGADGTSCSSYTRTHPRPARKPPSPTREAGTSGAGFRAGAGMYPCMATATRPVGPCLPVHRFQRVSSPWTESQRICPELPCTFWYQGSTPQRDAYSGARSPANRTKEPSC